MSAVVALCEEVTYRLGPDGTWPLAEMAEQLNEQLDRNRHEPNPLLALAVAAILELSREKQNSTERPTRETTCESGEPSDAEVKAVRRAVLETPGWLLAEPFSGRDVAGHLADAAIRALDAYREERRGG